MVNTGKPSGGCATCKARRIKCDETRPFCARCLSTNRNCPGFPPKAGLEFIDETSSVRNRIEEKKNQNHKRCLSLSQNEETEHHTNFSESRLAIDLDDNDPPTEISPHASDVPQAVNNSIDDIAVSYFFNYYCMRQGTLKCPRLYFLNIRDAYAMTPSTSLLFRAVKALALLVLANFSNLEWVRRRAFLNYIESLELLRSSISDIETAREDQVIFSSFLVCLFEVQTRTFSTEVYQTHLRGLTVLLKNRGTAQFKNHNSLGIFRAIRHQIILQATRHSCPLDPFWIGDEKLSSDDDYIEIPGSRLDLIATKISSLQFQAGKLHSALSSTEQAFTLLSNALELDRKFMACYQGFWNTYLCGSSRRQERNNYSSAEMRSPAMDPNNPTYAVFSAFYNDYRTYRILVQAIILRCLQFLLPGDQCFHDHRYVAALENCKRLGTEICNNVESFFENEDLKADEQQRGIARFSLSLVDGAWGAFSQIWPLSVLLSLELVSSDQREWIKTKLRLVTSKFGFQHAQHMCHLQPYLVFGNLGPKTPPERLAAFSPYLVYGVA